MKFLITAAITFLAAFFIYAQDSSYVLPDVVVTAGRVPLGISDLSRTVEIISFEDIRAIPVDNVQDLLQYSSGVDVRQRGTEGVQADISIRGGTFEQTLVMIDGIKVSDPQTGHHSFNLPLTPGDIERVEILKGQGSKSFGANAFSGVVNFITNKRSVPGLRLNAMGGDHGLFEYGANTSYSTQVISQHLSLSRRKSDGYRYNTDFDSKNIVYNSSLNFEANIINFLFGFNDKKFGANAFYPLAPNQWEHTTTSLLGASGEIAAGSFIIKPKISWRRNKDRYLLNKFNPSLYENNHRTDVISYELQASLTTGIGVTSFGAEFIKDKIVSSNLGNHSRETKGVFAEHNLSFDDFSLMAGGFAYNYPGIGWKMWPGIDLAYKPAPQTRLYASIGQAFRIPTYTDLYYTGGGSRGNPDLKHEETLNYEVGINYTHSRFTGNVSLFRKEGTNIIDWFYNASIVEWVAGNIAESTTNGAEISTSFYPLNNSFIYKIGLSYTYLDLQKKFDNTLSRYLLDHLRHQLILNFQNSLPFNIRQSWMFRFEDRINLETQFLVDTQISYSVSLFELYIKATNLLNKSYKDITTIPLPGRWISAGASMFVGF